MPQVTLQSWLHVYFTFYKVVCGDAFRCDEISDDYLSKSK